MFSSNKSVPLILDNIAYYNNTYYIHIHLFTLKTNLLELFIYVGI